jgi:hypothetical protein
MTNLSKLKFTTVQRVNSNNPTITRRNKLIDALKQQLHAHKLFTKKETCFVTKRAVVRNADGIKQTVENKVELKRWFFEKDNQWFVQCKYGTKVLLLNGKDNAVVVSKLEDVKQVFDTFLLAVENGELDTVIESALKKSVTVS